MSTAHLFTPLRVGSLELRNRIVIAPMCQYSADEGRATDWHLIHLGHLALSGAALLTIEATAVVPEGRISARDLGLWSDETEAALARTLESIRRWSDIPIAIQLAHAGRKASTNVPWEGGAQVPPGAPNGWQTALVPSNSGTSGSRRSRARLKRLPGAEVLRTFWSPEKRLSSNRSRRRLRPCSRDPATKSEDARLRAPSSNSAAATGASR